MQAKAKHEALIAGALLGVFFALGVLLVHALRNVSALRRQRIHDVDAVGVERLGRINVADLLDRRAHHLVVVEIGLGRNLACDNDQVGFHHRLARHAAVFVLRQTGVEDGVGNRIGNLVRMTLSHRLGRENIGFSHSTSLGRTEGRRKVKSHERIWMRGCVS